MERFLTIRQAARRLQVSEKFLRRLQAAGQLRVIRLGRSVRVTETELERICRREGQPWSR
jgi:excisionase family DNA binding protein